MEIFKLAGRIAINGAEEAAAKIRDIEQKAQQMASKVADKLSLNASINTSNATRSLNSLTTTIAAQQRTLQALKSDYMAVVVAQGKDSDAAKELAEEIDSLSAELKDNQKKLRDASKAADQLDHSLEDVSDEANKMSSAFKKIGAAMAAAFAVNKVVDFGKSLVQASANVSAEASAFAQIMGDYTEEAAAKVSKIADATGMVDTRLTPYMTSMTAKFKGLGYDVNEATDYAQRGLTLAADAAAFWDKSLDDSMGHLNSFINGSYEGGEAIGLFANDTQMAAYAVEQGVVKATKEWANLDEATKQATRLEYAENMMKQSGAVGQAAKESSQYANVQANLNEKWRQFKAQVGEPILQNIVIPAMSWLGDFITNTLVPAWEALSNTVRTVNNYYQENSTWINAIIIVLGVLIGLLTAHKVAAGISAAAQAAWNLVTKTGTGIANLYNASILKSGINLTVAAAKTIAHTAALVANKIAIIASTVAVGAWNVICTVASAVTTAFGAAVAFLTSPIGLVVLAIAALIAIVVLLIKHWDKVKEAAAKCWEGIKNIWSKVATWFKEKVIDPVVNFFKNNWKTILLFMVNPIAGAFKLIYEKCEGFRNFINNIVTSVGNFFKNLWTGVKNAAVSTFNAVKNAITNPVNAALNIVRGIVNKIKGLFNFKWSLPKLKVPKFAISPSGWKVGDLLKGKIPKLSVNWNADGAIFDKPAIFGTQYGLQGIGEAGAEAVAPIDKLKDYVSDSVRTETNGIVDTMDRLIEMLSYYFPQIAQNTQKEIVLNDGVLVGRLAPKINEKLADIRRSNERGR